MKRMRDALGERSITHANKPYLYKQITYCISWLSEMDAILSSAFLPDGARGLESANECISPNAALLFPPDQSGPYERGA